MFRTNLLSSNNLKTVKTSIDDYEELARSRNKSHQESNQAQRGDTKKAVKIILDVVRQEGCAANKEIPFRLPLGPDAYNVLKTKCEETLELLWEWKDISNSTDY